eukprot:TRINITY_DN12022_c0_g1_i1.p1 TRINITY_DN12022_c0_g1~~TRINITY_DN12022_c0_g1_i1.p1  ORF type:complete len:382 (-),score=89.62 TRINITY_DN12022_c0_g1_i1:23-1168(-)
MDQNQLKELVSFLSDRKPQVCLISAERVATITSSNEGRQSLKNLVVVRPLCRKIGDSDPILSRAVLSALINLSVDPHYVKQMLDNHIVSRLMDSILDKSNKVIELYAILLSNVTISVRGSQMLLQTGDALVGYYVTKLFELFESSADSPKDTFAWIAGILSNVTQIKEGRNLFIEKDFVKTLLSYLDHPNPVRKRGALGALRNIFFESEHHSKLLTDSMITSLLWPIRGPEQLKSDETENLPSKLKAVPSSKEREKDTEIKSMIIDCLLLLTSTKDGRDFLKKKDIYPIIREYDSVEENQEISSNIFNLLNIIKGLDESSKPVNVDPSKLVNTAGVTQHVDKIPEIEVEYEAEPVVEEPPKPKVPLVEPDLDENGDVIEEI